MMALALSAMLCCMGPDVMWCTGGGCQELADHLCRFCVRPWNRTCVFVWIFVPVVVQCRRAVLAAVDDLSLHLAS